MTHFLATVEFDARRSLPDLAADLATVIGVSLRKEESGRFDEVPAYVGGAGEIQLTLFGPTEHQDERECILEVSYRTSPSATLAHTDSQDFLQAAFGGTEVDSTGHINCSLQLASLLQASGFCDCKPVHQAR